MTSTYNKRITHIHKWFSVRVPIQYQKDYEFVALAKCGVCGMFENKKAENLFSKMVEEKSIEWNWPNLT